MHGTNGRQQERHCAGINSRGAWEPKAKQYITVQWDSAFTSYSFQNPSFEPLLLSRGKRHDWHFGEDESLLYGIVLCLIGCLPLWPHSLNTSSTFQSLTQKHPHTLPRVNITVPIWEPYKSGLCEYKNKVQFEHKGAGTDWVIRDRHSVHT